MESAAVVDILYRLKFIHESEYARIKTLLHRIVSMLAKLCFNLVRKDRENRENRGRTRYTVTD